VTADPKVGGRRIFVTHTSVGTQFLKQNTVQLAYLEALVIAVIDIGQGPDRFGVIKQGKINDGVDTAQRKSPSSTSWEPKRPRRGRPRGDDMKKLPDLQQGKKLLLQLDQRHGTIGPLVCHQIPSLTGAPPW